MFFAPNDRRSARARVTLYTAAGALLLSGGLRLRKPTPAAAFADKKQAGAELFASRGCAHCHGDNGEGTDRAPALRDLRKKLPEARMRDQIVHGGQGMPAFGDSLKPDEVDDLVAFLRAKKWITPPVTPGKGVATPSPSDAPAPAPGS